VERLVWAMREALRCEPAALASMGRAGAALVRRWHDVDGEAAKLERLFRSGSAAMAEDAAASSGERLAEPSRPGAAV
jgi:hypothetical protein